MKDTPPTSQCHWEGRTRCHWEGRTFPPNSQCYWEDTPSDAIIHLCRIYIAINLISKYHLILLLLLLWCKKMKCVFNVNIYIVNKYVGNLYKFRHEKILRRRSYYSAARPFNFLEIIKFVKGTVVPIFPPPSPYFDNITLTKANIVLAGKLNGQVWWPNCTSWGYVLRTLYQNCNKNMTFLIIKIIYTYTYFYYFSSVISACE